MSERGREVPDTGTRQRSRAVHRDRPCQNCGDPAHGEFCPSCGQRKVDVRVSVRAMTADLLEDELLLGRKLPRTLLALLFRPGRLTLEVVGGRWTSYVRPLKLYLVSSVVCFLLISFVSLRAVERVQVGSEALLVVEPSGGAPAGTPADSAVAPEGQAATTPGETGDGLGWIANASVNTGIERVDSLLAARLRRLGAMDQRDAIQEALRTFLGYGPTAIFLLLPLFAVVLKLLYLRSGRFYAEHVIFLLHLHAFVFVLLSVLLLARSWLGGLAAGLTLIWIASYGLLAMKRVYGQSWPVTLLKYWTLGWAYFWLLVLAVPVLLVTTVLLLPV